MHGRRNGFVHHHIRGRTVEHMDGATISQRARRAHILTYANIFDTRTNGDWLLTCDCRVIGVGDDVTVISSGGNLTTVDGIEDVDIATTFWFTPHRDPDVHERLRTAMRNQEALTLTVTRIPHITLRIHAYLNDIGGTAIAGWDLTGLIEQ